jgi:hypothetical protein
MLDEELFEIASYVSNIYMSITIPIVNENINKIGHVFRTITVTSRKTHSLIKV